MKTGAMLRPFSEKSIPLGQKKFHFNTCVERLEERKELIFKKLAPSTRRTGSQKNFVQTRRQLLVPNESAPLGNPAGRFRKARKQEVNYCSVLDAQQAFFSEVVQAAAFFTEVFLSSAEIVAAAVAVEGGATFTKAFVFSSY